jgi:hypothetical protein
LKVRLASFAVATRKGLAALPFWQALLSSKGPFLWRWRCNL